MNLKLNIFRKLFLFLNLQTAFPQVAIYVTAIILSACVFESKKKNNPPDNSDVVLRVSGTVSDKEGVPAAGSVVGIRSFRSDSNSISLLSKTTDAEVFADTTYSLESGQFSFEAVKPGNYSVVSYYFPSDNSDTLGALVPFAKITADTNLGNIPMLPIAHVTIELKLNGTPGSNLLCQIENFDLTHYSDSSGLCHFILAQGNYIVTVGDPSQGAINGFSINVFSGENKFLGPIMLATDTTLIPPKPQNLFASYDNYNGIVKLSWQPDTTGTLNYQVFRKINTEGLYQSIHSGISIQGNKLEDSLPPNFNDTSFFFYKVRSVRNGYVSDFSDSIWIKAVPPNKPSDPNPERGEIVNSLSPFLGWKGIKTRGEESVTYDVFVDTVENPSTGIVRGQSVPLVSLSNLKENTKYFWRVVAFVDGFEVRGPLWYFSTPPSPPENASPSVPDSAFPLDLSQEVNTSNITLSWKSSDADSDDNLKFDLYFSTNKLSLSKIATGLKSSSFTLGALNASTQYFWQVTASDGKATAIGPQWSFTTKSSDVNNNPPSQPGDPSPVDSAKNLELNIRLSWKSSDPDTSDELLFDILFGKQTPPIQRIATGLSASHYNLSNLSNGTVYYWQVIATDGQLSTPGKIWSFTTKDSVYNNNPPIIPHTPVPADSSDSRELALLLEWQGGDFDLDDTINYNVYLDVNDPPTLLLGKNLQNSNLQVTGLSTATRYFWYVLSSDGKSTSQSPTWSFTTKQPVAENSAPNTPIVVSPANDSSGLDTVLTLFWEGSDSDISDTLVYTLMFGTTNPPVDAITSNIMESRFSLSNLKYGTRYYWRVTSSDGKESVQGPVWAFETMVDSTPNNPPYIPSNPTPADLTQGTEAAINLSWTGGDPDSGETVSYKVYLGLENPPLSLAGTVVGTPQFFAPNLNSSSTYYWRIISEDNETSTQGPVWSFSTKDIDGTGQILSEVWSDVPGRGLWDLYKQSSYPLLPGNSFMLSSFSYSSQAENYYGIRLRGYIHPPSTGNYTFWISGDDNAALYLSSDENPENKSLIAYNQTYTDPLEWGRFPSQQSSPVLLEAGKRYYIESLLKDYNGDDHLAVGWQGPGISGESERPIPGNRLSPYSGNGVPAPGISVQPVSVSILEGQSAEFSVTAEASSPVFYEWQKNGVPIANSNTQNYTTPITSSSDDGATYRVMVFNSDGNELSEPATLSITQTIFPPAITTHPANVSRTEGQNVTFSVAASGTAPFSYSWYRNGTAIANAHSASYSFNCNLADNGAAYSVQVSNVKGSVVSNQAILTVNRLIIAPNITTHPANANVVEGNSANFSIQTSGTGPFNYQWRRNAVNIAGAVGANYSPANIPLEWDGSTIDVVVSNSAGIDTSNTATISVSPRPDPPVITADPVDTNVIEGEPATFRVTVSGTAPFNYVWLKNNSIIPGANQASYTTPSVNLSDNGSNYQVRVSNSSGSDTSTAAILSVTERIFPVFINTQPMDQNRNPGQTAEFSVAAGGTQPITFQWYRDNILIPGATLSSFTTSVLTLADNGSEFHVVATNSTGSVESNHALLTVADAPIVIETQPQSTNVVVGNIASFSVTATGTNLTYQWRKNSSPIPGATSSTYSTPNTVAGDDNSVFDVVISNGAGNIASQGANLNIILPPQITTQPVSQSVVSGNAVTFSVVAADTTGLSYQWRFGNNMIPGANAANYTINSVSSDDEGNYSVVITNAAGNEVSTSAALTVTIPPSILTQPQSQNIILGQSVQFSVTASGTPALLYQWRRNGNSISGATSSTYSIAEAATADTGNYTVTVTNIAGSVTSSAARLNVITAPEITGDPQDVDVAQGETAVFSVVSAGTPPFSYQWRRNDTIMTGQTGPTLNIASATLAQSGNEYDVIVSNTAGADTSAKALLTVSLQLTPPSITQNPQSQTVVLGQSASFTVSSTGTAPLSYSWAQTGGTAVVTNTGTFTIDPVTMSDAGSYTVTVSNSAGSDESAPFTLTVIAPPSISSHPASLTVPFGSPANFNVTAAGDGPLSYQWTKGGAAIDGATNSTYSIGSTINASAGEYNVVVSNAAGNVTSNAAVLRISPVISVQPQSDTAIVGDDFQFNVTAAGPSLSYQWMKESTIVGNSPSLTIDPVESVSAGSYSVTVSNTAGSVTSSTVSLTVITLPVISSHPVSHGVINGDSAQFAVSATGFNLSYQWRFNGSNIPGANSSILSLSSTTQSSAGSYDVVVNNPAGTVTSNAAVLAIYNPPAFSTQPVSSTADEGGTASFSASVTGDALLTYRWHFNGSPISNGNGYTGANSATLSISPVSLSHDGNYTLVASNDHGSETSNVASLSVTPTVTLPVIATQPVNQEIQTGSPFQFSVVANGSDLTYQWFFESEAISDATESSYRVARASSDHAGEYYVIVRNSAGSVTSAVATLTVNPPPSITAAPLSQTVSSGSNVTFSVDATGTGTLRYSWKKDGNTITSFTNSPQLNLTGVSNSNEGSYTVVVSDSYGTAESAPAFLTVNTPPSITTQPVSQATSAGGISSFSVTASGDPTLSYQWYFRGTPITQSNNSYSGWDSRILQINNVNAARIGTYSVVVTNSFGSTTSVDVTLTLE